MRFLCFCDKTEDLKTGPMVSFHLFLCHIYITRLLGLCCSKIMGGNVKSEYLREINLIYSKGRKILKEVKIGKEKRKRKRKTGKRGAREE